MNAPTVGSLFSGVGGIDLAFQRENFAIVFQVEIDPYCQKVLAKHWPDVPRFEDVKNVGRRNLPTVDVLAGGFPCQDISIAGKGEGIVEGNRSGLWFEFARIIGELRPRVVFLENVPPVTANGGTIVIGQLAAMGYDAEWCIVPAAAVGAPHRRDRWFCVAYTDSFGRPEPRTGDTCNDIERDYSTREPVGRTVVYEAVAGRQIMADADGGQFEKQWIIDAEQHAFARSRCCGHELADSAGESVDVAAGSEREHLPDVAAGSKVMGDSDGLGRREARTDAHAGQPNIGRSSSTMANTSSAGWQELGVATVTDRSRHVAGRDRATNSTSERSFSLEPGILRGTHGLSIGMDRSHQWPARPGQSQHDWEPPRTVDPKSVPNRTNRLKALGNSVVPQVIQPFAKCIYEYLTND